MSQPGQRLGTALGNEQHVLQALWSSKYILTLGGGLWVCAVSALVLPFPYLITELFLY